jgi:hypothetical protein
MQISSNSRSFMASFERREKNQLVATIQKQTTTGKVKSCFLLIRLMLDDVYYAFEVLNNTVITE